MFYNVLDYLLLRIQDLVRRDHNWIYRPRPSVGRAAYTSYTAVVVVVVVVFVADSTRPPHPNFVVCFLMMIPCMNDSACLDVDKRPCFRCICTYFVR